MSPFADVAAEAAAATPAPSDATHSAEGSTVSLTSLADYEHISAAAAALRALPELGYQYQVTTDAGRIMAVSAQPPPAPGGGVAVVEVQISLPGAQPRGAAPRVAAAAERGPVRAATATAAAVCGPPLMG
eukprot:XP_001702835.1 predicted protein [Chlamydomonas reinhardtii]